MLNRVVTAVVLGMLWSPTPALNAQWVHYPTPGVPRLETGRPNLDAPTPRTADGKPNVSGLWQVSRLLPCDDVQRMCTDLPISRQFGNIGAGVAGGFPHHHRARGRMSAKGVAAHPSTHSHTPGGPPVLPLPPTKQIRPTPGLLLPPTHYNPAFRHV